MIDTAIWDSEQVMGLTPGQFKIYIYLISRADDEGRLKVTKQLWRTRIFPLDAPSPEEFEEDLNRIFDTGLLISFEYDDELYCYHPNWKRYQNISHPTDSKLPSPSFPESSGKFPKVPEDSGQFSLDKVSLDKKYLKKDTLSGKPDVVSSDFDVSCKAIILALNALAGTHFKHDAKGTRRLIKARFQEGATLQDFEKVIKIKVEQWADDEKFKSYLRPETLFAANHFESYRNDYEIKHEKGE